MSNQGKEHASLFKENWPDLARYEGAFKEPLDLPPPRVREHTINMFEGQDLVNVHPYCYPYHKKKRLKTRSRSCWH